jgi:hypothetical protein
VPNKALQQNRDDVLRCGESIGCDLLKAAVRQQEAQSQSRQVKRTSLAAVAVASTVVVAATALVAAFVLPPRFNPFVEAVGDGVYKLTVRVQWSKERPKAVMLCARYHRREAEWFVANAARDHLPWQKKVDPFDGGPLTVSVWFGGRSSEFWGTSWSKQERYLAIVAKLEDGRRVGKVVEIPDRKTSRELVVALP